MENLSHYLHVKTPLPFQKEENTTIRGKISSQLRRKRILSFYFVLFSWHRSLCSFHGGLISYFCLLIRTDIWDFFFTKSNFNRPLKKIGSHLVFIYVSIHEAFFWGKCVSVKLITQTWKTTNGRSLVKHKRLKKYHKKHILEIYTNIYSTFVLPATVPAFLHDKYFTSLAQLLLILIK